MDRPELSHLLSELAYDHLRQLLVLLLEAQQSELYADFIFLGVSALIVLVPIAGLSAADLLVRVVFLPRPRRIRRTDELLLENGQPGVSGEANAKAVVDVNENSTEELIETLSQLEELQTDTISLRDTIQQLEEAQRQLELRNQRTLAQVEDLQAEVAALRAQNHTLALVAEHSKDLVALNDDFKVQLERIGSTRMHTESLLSNVVENASESAALFRKLESEIRSLRQELAENSAAYEESLASMEAELVSQREVISKLTDGEGVLEARLEEAQRQAVDSETVIAHLEEDIRRLSQSQEEMKAEYHRSIETLETALTEQSDRLQELVDVRAGLEAQVLTLKNEASISSNKISLLKSELAKQSNQSKVLSREQLEELLLTKNALEVQKATVEDLLEVNTRAVCEIDELKYSLQQINDRLRERTSTHEREVSAYRAELVNVKEELAEVEQEKQRLESRMALESEVLAKRSDDRIKELEELETALRLQVQSLEESLQTTSSSLEGSARECLRLQQELEVKTEAALLIEAELRLQREARLLSEEEIGKLSEKLQQQALEVEQMRSSVEEYGRHVAQLDTDKQAVEEELRRARSEIVEYEVRVAEVSAEVNRQAAASELAVREKQERLQLLIDDHQRAEERAEALNLEVNDLRSTISALEAERESALSTYREDAEQAALRADELERLLNEHKLALQEAERMNEQTFQSKESLDGHNKILATELEHIRSELEQFKHHKDEETLAHSSALSSLQEMNDDLESEVAKLKSAKEDTERYIADLRVELERNREDAKVYEAEIRSLVQIQEMMTKDFEDKLEVYRGECEKLRQTLEESQRDRETLEQDAFGKESMLREELQRSVLQHEAELTKIRSALKSESARLLEALEGKSMLESQLASSNEEMAALQLRNSTLKQEMATLQRNAWRAGRNREGSLGLREEVDLLRRSVSEAMSRDVNEQQLSAFHDVLTREKEELIAKLQSAEGALLQIQAEYEDLKSEHDKLISEHDQSLEVFRRKEEELLNIEKQMTLASVEYEKSSAGYIAEIDRLQTEMKHSKAIIEMISSNKDDLSAKLLQAAADLALSAESVKRLELEVARITLAYQDEVALLSSKYEAELREHQAISEELIRFKSALEAEVLQRAKTQEELSAANRELENANRWVNLTVNSSQ